MQPSCLFCESNGPFATTDHIIPESLGNDDLLLAGEVCDGCQRYFGKEVEKYVLEKTPIGMWRALLGIQSKKGKLPSVDLSLPERSRGLLPEKSAHHDNRVGFTAHEDGSTSIDIDNSEIMRAILDGSKTDLRFVLSPKHLVQIGRFLGKIAIELHCLSDAIRARHERYNALRRYSRFGITEDIWPIFHCTIGSLSELCQFEQDDEGVLQHSLCYQYALADGPGGYELFSLRVGTDQWTLCTNNPYPTPVIRDAFPDRKLNIMWYDRDEWRGQ